MSKWAGLCMLAAAACTCAAWVGGEEPGRQWGEEGTKSCGNIFPLEVYRGGNQSLNRLVNAEGQILVKKCDPERKTWEVKNLAAFGNSLMNTRISLVNGKFTVRNSEKTDEGLYKIEWLLNNSCLAAINLTVLDHPLPAAVTTSSSTVTTKATETPETSPPGTHNIEIWVGVFLVTIILIVTGFFTVRKLKQKKFKCTPNEATPAMDLEQPLNGSPPHQQQENTSV